jgi:hypothetical protein
MIELSGNMPKTAGEAADSVYKEERGHSERGEVLKGFCWPTRRPAA